MRIYNRSRLPKEEIRELLDFAMQGIKDNEVLIEVTDSDKRYWTGMAFNIGTNEPDFYNSILPEKYIQRYWPKGKNSQYCYFITLRVPAKEYEARGWRFDERWMMRKYPEGLPMDSWQDNFIMLAAHEGRHVWQFLRNKRLRAQGKKRKQTTEVDANNHGVRIFNKWREKTGRSPIEAIKQANPFEKGEVAA